MTDVMLGSALRNTCGPLGDLLEKLKGADGELWFRAMKRFLRKENPWGMEPATPRDWPTWKTIQLGMHSSANDVRNALLVGEYDVDRFAVGTLGGITVAPSKTSIDLVMVTAEDLGFLSPPEFDGLLARAREFGLVPCPTETGPALRLQCDDEFGDPHFYIISEPIPDFDDKPSVFIVYRGFGTRALSACAVGGGGWLLEFKLIFCRSPRGMSS